MLVVITRPHSRGTPGAVAYVAESHREQDPPHSDRRGSMHIVIMGCGRVGSTLAHILEDSGHSVAIIDRDPQAFRRLRARVQGSQGDRDRLRPRRPGRGRHRGRGRLRGGEQRRQLEHHLRQGRPRDIRRGQRRGQDLRLPAGRGLPAAGHPHRGHGPLDRRPDPAPRAARRAPSRSGATPAGAWCWRRWPSTAGWIGTADERSGGGGGHPPRVHQPDRRHPAAQERLGGAGG